MGREMGRKGSMRKELKHKGSNQKDPVKRCLAQNKKKGF